jgi:hypothetical protein
MPKRIVEPMLSEKVKVIHSKLQEDRTGKTLTQEERNLEVTHEEAAHLLSAIASRRISHRYLGQLTRDDKDHKRRLQPYRSVGSAYTYQVEALLKIRFIKQRNRKQSQQGSEEGSEAA